MTAFASLIADFAAAWCANDAPAVTALFDTGDPEVACLFADAVDPAIGAAACAAAVEARCAAIGQHVYTPREILTRDLGPDLAAAFFLIERAWVARAGTDHAGTRLGQKARATLVARRIGTAWRIAHYAEAPVAPLLELQAYYQNVAADGLDAIPPRPWAKTSRSPS
ncbi:MAG: nuclear transport factor 2 family protein [Rhodobacteraceae bacterium]|nr:nuclear transport factor 2 family protein [Paracoccaceae bacterium]